MDVLGNLKPSSVHTCVTSPPYWGLRDYGTAEWEGGDADCDHRHQLGGEGASSAKQNTSAGSQSIAYAHVCGKCGATRIDDQLGLESTPDEYVEKMVAVFREVRRVLRDDGTVWLNLGDSYYNYRPGPVAQTKQTIANHIGAVVKSSGKRGIKQVGLKEKDLVGIPWRVAFALQADGWYLRSDIIWSKSNPMPESVRDRPTKAHEYIFLLSKQKSYYYDADAIAEEAKDWSTGGPGTGMLPTTHYHGNNGGNEGLSALAAKYKSGDADKTRNRRTVWTVTTQPYPGAHFATFPEALIEPCILAGCPRDGTVLDPFFGAGTVGVVAKRAHRNCVGIDLNAEYCEMASQRLNQSELFATLYPPLNGDPADHL